MSTPAESDLPDGRSGAGIALRLPRGHRRWHPPGDTPSHAGTLAAQVARRIEDETIGSGRPVGHNLGSEQELQDRHGVSRAVLREAVRLLEYHGVARMRRGPGGGLIVTAPDPTASMETITLYLDYRRTGAADLVVVRESRRARWQQSSRTATRPASTNGSPRRRVTCWHGTNSSRRVLEDAIDTNARAASGWCPDRGDAVDRARQTKGTLITRSRYARPRANDRSHSIRTRTQHSARSIRCNRVADGTRSP
jgi:hypothetical protein